MEKLTKEMKKVTYDNIDYLLDTILGNVANFSYAQYLPQNKELIKSILLKLAPLIFELAEKSMYDIKFEELENKDVVKFVEEEVINHYKRGITLDHFIHFLFIIYESFEKLYYERLCEGTEKCYLLGRSVRRCFYILTKQVLKFWEKIKSPEAQQILINENLKLSLLKKHYETKEIFIKNILNFMGGLFFITDKKLNIIFMSELFGIKFGIKEDQITNFYDFHTKFHFCNNGICPIIDGIKKRGGSEFIETFTLSDRKEVILKIKLSEDFEIGGEPCKLVLFREFSGNIEELETILFNEIANAAEMSIVLTDLSGHIEYVNRFFEKITGYSANEALGQNPKILKSGAHDELFYKELWDTILSGNVWKGRFKNKRKDGSFYYEKAVIIPIKNSEGKILKFAALKEDITKQVELENQIQINQRFEYLNRLVGRFAHDFNNVLTYLYAISDEMESYAKDEHLKELVSGNKKALMKVADMIKGLSAFSKRQHLELEKLTIKELYEEFLSINKKLIPSNITLISNFNDYSYINADRVLIGQVLYNIIINAKDAVIAKYGSAEGGRISIISEKQSINTPYVVKIGEFDTLSVKPGDYITIKISDNGIGISKKHIFHVFEPLYTTKNDGQKVGLGLSAAYGIIKQHNGYIFIESTEGIGTDVIIMLPEYKEIKKDDKVEFKDEQTKIYKLPPINILVVDDDPQILDFMDRVITLAGAKVIKYDNFTDAMNYIKMANELDFLIVDYVLKDGNGLELYEKARERFVKLRSIVTSGHADDNLRKHPDFNRVFLFLKKPFKGSSLINLIKFFLESYRI